MGIAGFGTTLSGGTAGAIAEVTNLSWSGAARAPLDTSTHGTTGGDATFVPSGIIDHGEVSVELQYAIANFQKVMLTINDVAEVWTLTLPDAAKVTFSGFVTSLGAAFPHDGVITQEMTIKCAGLATWATS